MNIVLVGFMGTGKTVVAKRLSEKLNKKYISLDDNIVKRVGKPITKFFAENGESYFRKIEKEIIQEASFLENVVIDAGGGVVKDNENVENLKMNGMMVCLTATPEVIYNRTKYNSDRPLLNVTNPKKKIQRLLEQRAPFYEKTDYTIDTSTITVDEVAEKIIGLMNKT